MLYIRDTVFININPSVVKTTYLFINIFSFAINFFSNILIISKMYRAYGIYANIPLISASFDDNRTSQIVIINNLVSLIYTYIPIKLIINMPSKYIIIFILTT